MEPKKLSDVELAKAIRLDIEAELDAINLYESHLESTDNPEAKKVLEHVIKEEKDHVSLFLELLKTLDPEQEDILMKSKEYFGSTVKEMIERSFDEDIKTRKVKLKKNLSHNEALRSVPKSVGDFRGFKYDPDTGIAYCT